MFLGRMVRALHTTSSYPRTQAFSGARRLTTTGSPLLSSLEEDFAGRRIRRKFNDDNDNVDDDNDAWKPKTRERDDRGGQDDGKGDDDWGTPWPSRQAPSGRNDNRKSVGRGWDGNYTPKPRSSRRGGGPAERGNWRGGVDKPNHFNDERRNAPSDFSPRGIGGGRGRQNGQYRDPKEAGVRQINMNNLEAEGFVHLYGLSSVLNALQANQRDLTTIKERSAKFGDDGDGDDEYSFTDREPPKPQAQFRPYLFVQERKSSGRRGQKAADAERVLALAEERGVPVAEVDKGILNTLSANRPHQVRNRCQD